MTEKSVLSYVDLRAGIRDMVWGAIGDIVAINKKMEKVKKYEEEDEKKNEMEFKYMRDFNNTYEILALVAENNKKLECLIKEVRLMNKRIEALEGKK